MFELKTTLWCCLIIAILPINSFSANLSKRLAVLAEKDTVCKVWVWFNDKNMAETYKPSLRSALRREKVHYVSNVSDLPVNSTYIAGVEGLGGKLRHIFKWENCASFLIQSSKVNAVASLPYVNSVTLVNSLIRREIQSVALQKSLTADDSLQYGNSYHALNMINVPAAHNYLKNVRGFKAPGDGVLVAFFDTGFRLDHDALQNVKKSQIKATYDFIDNDTSVADPDSVVNNVLHPYHGNDEHGSMVLSLVDGYDPGKFIGVAWGAQFVLARTENTYFDSVKNMEVEIHSEEDDWAAAVVWAESLGVDIVSSSLGYRDGFQDSVQVPDGSSYRELIDYEYDDLDGKTTVVSRAALNAVQRGMVVVNAMGNEGSNSAGTICAPADVDGVISVGAVQWNGDKIANFSSTGPTADGRIKPECVAQGVQVGVPAIYGESSSYTSGSGTSFATPMIAGVCALIYQSMSVRNSTKLRDILFASCSYLPGQVTRNNYYGYGLPDALEACKSGSGAAENGVDFFVYPNIIKPGDTRDVSFTLTNPDDNEAANIRVLSVDGTLVWKTNVFSKNNNQVLAIWQCRNTNGKKVVPGIYFAVLEYKGTAYKKKIIIAG